MKAFSPMERKKMALLLTSNHEENQS